MRSGAKWRKKEIEEGKRLALSFYICAIPEGRKGIFVIRDWLFLFFANSEFNNSSCFVTKRLSLPPEKLEFVFSLLIFPVIFSVSRPSNDDSRL